MSTQCSFLSWVRQGAVAALSTPDADNLKGHAKLPIHLDLSTPIPDDNVTIDVDLRLYGPADIIGIDRHQIIRTEPQPRSRNVLPNQLVAIEFARPDFPWLFTPARAETQKGRLRPWLCLVVVRRQEGVSLRSRSSAPLPVLSIQDPAIAHHELPDLSESWAWVHSQVVHEVGSTNLETVLTSQPSLTLSRLLCPRRLEANTAYYACLVPAFKVGLKVGLGLPFTETEQDIDRQILEPAWINPRTIDLPVYYHWEFQTGEAGDFEDLARQLIPQTLPDGTGTRRLYVGQAGVSDWEDFGSMDFAGVFRPPNLAPALPDRAQMTDAQQQWVEELAAVLTAPGEPTQVNDPLVGPPIYGHFQQSLQQLPTLVPNWVRDLNLDVRNRIAAGLGAYCVQSLQEELMHAAWQQLGDIQQAQQLVRQSELGQEVSQAMHIKHFVPQEGALLYQITAPSHSRVLITPPEVIVESAGSARQPLGPETLKNWSERQQLPTQGTVSAFRKLSRPGGAIARRMADQPITQPLAVQTAQAQPTTPAALTTKPLGKVRLDLIGQMRLWVANATDQGARSRMATAIDKLQAHLQPIAIAPPPRLHFQPFDGAVQTDLQANFNPRQDLIKRLNSHFRPASTASVQLSASRATSSEAAIAPLQHPTFPQPMYEVIRQFMPDLLLSGIDRLPENSVTLLTTNAQFIESFMVGLNHEMSRELLWRNFPTDQRGTYFQNFWTQDRADISKIHRWSLGDRLGDTLDDGIRPGPNAENSSQLALVIRAELLRRFPNTIIYAVKAATPTTLSSDPQDQRYPVHRGELGSDAVFLLFDLAIEAVKGNASNPHGWFFLIQQQPTATRFGLDVTAPTPTPTQWMDLAWEHLVIRPGGHISMANSGDRLTTIDEPDGPQWNFNGAHMANIFLQQPYRVGIHASRLLL